MAYSKVIVNNKVIIDLENDTVDAGHLVSGYTAHNASGEIVTGSLLERTVDDCQVIGNQKIVIPPGVYLNPITIMLAYKDDGESISVSPYIVDEREEYQNE